MYPSPDAIIGYRVEVKSFNLPVMTLVVVNLMGLNADFSIRGGTEYLPGADIGKGDRPQPFKLITLHSDGKDEENFMLKDLFKGWDVIVTETAIKNSDI